MKNHADRGGPAPSEIGESFIHSMYSRIPVTRILKGNEKQQEKFELARFLVIGVDLKIQFAMLKM